MFFCLDAQLEWQQSLSPLASGSTFDPTSHTLPILLFHFLSFASVLQFRGVATKCTIQNDQKLIMWRIISRCWSSKFYLTDSICAGINVLYCNYYLLCYNCITNSLYPGLVQDVQICKTNTPSQYYNLSCIFLLIVNLPFFCILRHLSYVHNRNRRRNATINDM